MAKLSKIFKFSPAELMVLLEAWFVFLKWDLLISFTRYENWRDKLGGLHNAKQSDNVDSKMHTELNSQLNSHKNSHQNQYQSQNQKQHQSQHQNKQPIHTSTTNTASTIEQVHTIIKLSEIAGRFHIRKMNCLRRCISQEKMLEKRGFKPCMHIGVRFENEQLKAHAWLTLQGIVINDNEDVATRYSELKANNPQALLLQLA